MGHSMGRARNKEHKGYPKGWRKKNGAFRYRVPPGLEHLWGGKKEFTLGKTESEAYKIWADRLQLQKEARTIAQLLDRYEQQVVPEKSTKAQDNNHRSIKRLRKVFGHMLIHQIEPHHAYSYFDVRERTRSAKSDIEVLRHSLTKAVSWGLLRQNPLLGKQVQLEGNWRRDRYVEDWELEEALRVASKMIRAYIALKVLTGLRRKDILLLRQSDLRDDGIHVQPSKTKKTTGKRLIIEWTPELEAAKDAALAARPKDIAPWLFCTRKGECYQKDNGTANGFDSIWQRFMAKALKETGLEERFQERDLRAKTASEMPLELAQALLGHADPRITQRVYRRRPDRVKPLR